MTTPAPAAAPAKGAKSATQAPVLAPFRAGTQPTYKPSGYSQVNALTTTAIELPDYQIGPTNLLRAIEIEVSCVGVGSATVAFQGDMPLGCLSTVNFQDSGGNSIVGSFDSYTIAMIMKYGGYAGGLRGDPLRFCEASGFGGLFCGGAFLFGDAGGFGGIDRRSDRLVQPGHLLDAAVSLAGQVDDSDDGAALGTVGVVGGDLAELPGQRGAFGEADLPLPGAVERVARVGDDGQVGGAVGVRA